MNFGLQNPSLTSGIISDIGTVCINNWHKLMRTKTLKGLSRFVWWVLTWYVCCLEATPGTGSVPLLLLKTVIFKSMTLFWSVNVIFFSNCDVINFQSDSEFKRNQPLWNSPDKFYRSTCNSYFNHTWNQLCSEFDFRK